MQKKFIRNSSISGFTLLEMLVVIIIVGIVGAIAVPSWLAFVDVLRLSAAQNEVYLAMREAQSEAVKHKLTWQVSLRQQNGTVQWAVHQADPEQFVADAVLANNGLWHNLEQNVHLDLERNERGKYETTFAKQSPSGPWRAMFNYQGCPIYEVNNDCTQTSLRALGQISFASQYGGQARRCIYISTILGAMRTGKEHQIANENSKYCY